MNPRPADNRTTAAISQLLHGIFRGDFQVGDHLTEAFLAEKLGTSRTPVREALVELKGLGLLEVRRNRGALVKGFGAQTLREIYEVRRLLEVEATAKATVCMDREKLAELLQASRHLRDTGEDDEDWRLDRRIHQGIADDCGNQMLRHEIQRFSVLVQAIRRTVGSRIRVQKETADQHVEILQAMVDGQVQRAADAMDRHLLQAEASALAAIVDWESSDARAR